MIYVYSTGTSTMTTASNCSSPETFTLSFESDEVERRSRRLLSARRLSDILSRAAIALLKARRLLRPTAVIPLPPRPRCRDPPRS